MSKAPIQPMFKFDEDLYAREIFPSASVNTVRDKEELAFAFLSALPRSSLAAVQRRIAPLLHFDILGLLPDEIALEVLTYLPSEALLTCSLVSRRWRALADDQSLWRSLCLDREWEWRIPSSSHDHSSSSDVDVLGDSDDEGMGDEEDSESAVEDMLMEDSGFSSMLVDPSFTSSSGIRSHPRSSRRNGVNPTAQHFASPPEWPQSHSKPDYKLLHQTHVRLRNRMLSGSYRLHTLQSTGTGNSHTNAIYCLQLYTYPDTGIQVLFTGSKDRSIREWDLTTGEVIRVIENAHELSVLSISIHDGLLASGGSDRQVIVWNLQTDTRVKSIRDHEDSVLCVRLDSSRLVSCSKDRTVRTYAMPHLAPQHILRFHRAAVNAVAMSSKYIVSASGDRCIRLWDAESGVLLRTFENHHGRGIAALDFKSPFILSGSSDKHLRLLDVTTSQGWSTAPDFAKVSALAQGGVCEACGSRTIPSSMHESVRSLARSHEDLVRSVALNSDFVVSGSYDYTVKVWDRKSGMLVADLAGGHNGRIFCVGFDCAKIVSCGEDQRICIWDFSHGIDTSFMKF